MNPFQQRIKALEATFLKTIEHIENSKALTQQNTPETMQFRIQYIGAIIKQNLNDQKEHTIMKLLEKIQQLQKNNRQADIIQLERQHQTELLNLKKQYEAALQRNSKERNVKAQIRGYIDERIADILKDYVLKIVHEQQVKRLKTELAKQKQKYKQEDVRELKNKINQLLHSNDFLRNQLSKCKQKLKYYQQQNQSAMNEISLKDSNRSQFSNIKVNSIIKEQKTLKSLSPISKNSNTKDKQQSQSQVSDHQKLSKIKKSFNEELENLRQSLKEKHLKLLKQKERHSQRNKSQKKPQNQTFLTAEGQRRVKETEQAQQSNIETFDKQANISFKSVDKNQIRSSKQFQKLAENRTPSREATRLGKQRSQRIFNVPAYLKTSEPENNEIFQDKYTYKYLNIEI